MTTYEPGQTLTFTLGIESSPGVPANLGVTPTCTVTKPDGSTASASVTNPATGTYYGQLASVLPGRYLGKFTGSGANSGALPYTDVIDVWPADPRLAIGLADAKAALNMPSTITTHDDELRLYIASATVVVEDIIGPFLAESRTHTFDGGRGYLVLPEVPIAGVTSVTVNGVALAASAYAVDEFSGTIRSWYGAFRWGMRNVVVTYTVGATVIPPNVILACRELVRFQYQIGQQGSGRGRVTQEADAWTPSGFAVPRRVIELLQPQQTTAS